jgi:hypothetical protein
MNGPASADRQNFEETSRTERLTVATLRRAVPIRLWGGKGCGIACDFCRVLVSDTEVEYEVDAQLDERRLTLHFHPRCYDIWKTESEAAAAAGAIEPGDEAPPLAKTSP